MFYSRCRVLEEWFTYFKRIEKCVIYLLQFGIEFDRSHLINDINQLSNIQQQECKVPGEDIWCTDHVPCPSGQQHETYGIKTLIFVVVIKEDFFLFS